MQLISVCYNDICSQLSLLDRKLNQYVKGGDLSCGENAEG